MTRNDDEIEIVEEAMDGHTAAVLGLALRQARRRLGTTQAELAQHIDVKPATVSAWETSRTRPSASMVFQVLLTCRISANDFAEMLDESEALVKRNS